MPALIKDEIVGFIEPNIQIFHQKRLDNIQSLQLKKILVRKNPYLFKAKNLGTAHDLVKSLLDAHLSSQEEGISEVSLKNWQFLSVGMFMVERSPRLKALTSNLRKKRLNTSSR
jgi:hypothetical protein